MTHNTLPNTSSSTDISDETLMLQVAQGNQQAFNQLVRRWKQPLANYFFRQLGAAESAEELTQEVFVRLWKTKNYQVKARFSTWIYRLAQHLLIDHWRKFGRRPQQTVLENHQDWPLEQASPEQLTLASESQHLLHSALQSLPPRQQQVLVLSKFQDLKYAEIAEILNCPSEQVKVQVFRAVQSLGKKLKELWHDR